MSLLTSTRVRALALLAGTFVAGAAAGAAADHAWRPAKSEPPTVSTRRENPTRPDRVEDDRIPFPLEVLQLTPDEETRLHAIARRWRPKSADLVAHLRTDVSDLENGMFAEMLCAVSPDKQQRYLAQLQENNAGPELIERRFRLVRANQCGEIKEASR